MACDPSSDAIALESGLISMKSCKIRIVEDDDDDALLLKRTLARVARRRDIALAITHSVDGLEGLAALRGEPSDAVVVDLNMPRMDGIRFLQSLRSDGAFPGLRVVVLTASTERVAHQAAFEAGADRVFVKPNTYEELAAIAEQILASALAISAT